MREVRGKGRREEGFKTWLFWGVERKLDLAGQLKVTC